MNITFIILLQEKFSKTKSQAISKPRNQILMISLISNLLSDPESLKQNLTAMMMIQMMSSLRYLSPVFHQPINSQTQRSQSEVCSGTQVRISSSFNYQTNFLVSRLTGEGDLNHVIWKVWKRVWWASYRSGRVASVNLFLETI